jgi:hydroxypyruvate isomerase
MDRFSVQNVIAWTTSVVYNLYMRGVNIMAHKNSLEYRMQEKASALGVDYFGVADLSCANGLIRKLDRMIGICFDVGHANISEGSDLGGAFSRNAHRIIHIHLDDNLGIEDDHFQPGEGNIDLESFYNVVEESGYDGMVQLEVKMKEGDEPMEFYLRNYRHFISMI